MRPNLKFPIIVFLAWYLIILFLQVFGEPHYFYSSDFSTLKQRIFTAWIYNWDGGHYLSVAQNGYVFPKQNFFPLWPLLIKIFTFGIFSVELVAFILTFVLSLTTFILFYLLASLLTTEKNAKLSLIIFASFPSAMFLRASYTENLFLTLTLLSFWLLEKKRFILSGLVGGLAGATRSVGIAMSVVYFALRAPLKKKIIYCLLGSSGILGFMVYQQLWFNDPLLFTKAHQDWCINIGQCQLTFPLNPLMSYFSLLLQGWIKPNLSPGFLDWVSSVIFLCLLWPVYKYLKKSYFIYAAIVLFLPLATGMLSSMTRYVLVAFPVFFILPLIIRSKIFIYIICILLFLLQLRFAELFINKIWVA